ncbi:polyamine aminopropyltransferase [Pseudalkalibacillus caeni]|uniref:Polyamine aminopropyltransferase n=1 Tax=Exobacillus caeni TaxID=2574798 RepID=A0A5R9F5U0_9BACL|nr:polyamine aminopropyltransferase [Pseudalkalibacillus caeni]TLS39122.1 polyamine aminopropyltransferase [Pseudalkalibacillus caeni]
MMTELERRKSSRIYWASGIVSICGIIFEVLFGALGSYILGDGVKQYTITISLFLTGMGIGASLSEKVMKRLILTFIVIEFMIALVGGLSSFFIFGLTAFVGDTATAVFLYSVILLVGGLTGLELPILIRKANEIGVEINKSTARVLFSDYAGGLIGGLLFAFLLRPEFGLVTTAFLVAIVNVAIGIWILITFRAEIPFFRILSISAALLFSLMIGGALFGEEIAFSFEQKMYKDPVILSEDTNYQRIVVTKEQGDTRLYLDGQLQFSSSDEYRYHETLVHIPMAVAEHPSDVLVLGGGDGLAVRELLKYDSLNSVTLVDLDPRVTELASTNHHFLELNKGSLKDKKVTIVNDDAFKYLKKAKNKFDVILVDLPDPNNESLNKLYTWEFYSLIRNHLKEDGAVMVQATSPVFATEVYWTINETIEKTGLVTKNFHVDIPSFGNWGFVLGTRHPVDMSDVSISVETRFLSDRLLTSLTDFGKDEDEVITDQDGNVVKMEPNTLIRPNLIEKYEKAWQNY